MSLREPRLFAEMARKLGSFLIYISTDYVFDGNKGMYKDDNPINYYGYTKPLGENFCQNFCKDLCYLTEQSRQAVRLTSLCG